MVRKIQLSDSDKNFIIDHYSKAELSISEIARQLKVDRGVVMRNAKEMGLVKVFPKGTRGKKFIWTKEKDELLIELYASSELTVAEIAEKLGTSEDTTTKRARFHNIWKKPKTIYTEEDIDYIKKRAQSMSITEIANHIGLSNEFVRLKIKELGLTDVYFDKKKERWELKQEKERARINQYYIDHKRPGITPIEDDEFLWDLSNPHYTTFFLGKKYDLHPSTIGNWRKKIFGDFKAAPKESGSMTELEYKISEILKNDFDKTYFFAYQIGKWNIDFYLGDKKIIEAQGVRWHSSEKVIEKDKRKRNELTLLGYKILYVHENDLKENEDDVTKQIQGFLQQ